MTSSNNPNEAGTIEQLAAEWAVRLDAGTLDDVERAQLDAWLALDPRHLGALVKVRAQWTDLDRLAAIAGSRAASAERERAAARPHGGGLWSRRRLIAASLGGVSLFGFGWSMLATAGEYYSSAVGEVRRIPLEDGSTLILNTDSQARVHYSREWREVRLVQGEALFEVVHDAQRPFVVESAAGRDRNWQLRATGTVFSVRLRGTEVDVTVSEGVVELAKSGATHEPLRRIAAREETVLAPAQPIRVRKLQEAALERRFAWLNGMVAFSGEPLADAVAEINRHNRRPIIIDDAELARQPVVGAFRATDSEAFAAAAAAALGARSVSEDDGLHLRALSAMDVQRHSGGNEAVVHLLVK
jgi:transmembrane sensor